jgi:hypothetical protein
MFNFTDSQFTDAVEDDNFSLERYFMSSEIEDILQTKLNQLNKTDSYIITALCCNNISMKLVAKDAGVSMEKVQAVKDKFCEEARFELAEYYGC